jgi:hypothetical protein
MKRLTFLVLLTSMLASTALWAHSGEDHGEKKAPNGGQLMMAGIYQYELVVAKDSQETKDSPIYVYVTDHAGTKISTVGAVGTATILSGKVKATASLTPDGDGRLKGAAKYASSPDVKVVISITLPGKSAESARFTPYASGH